MSTSRIVHSHWCVPCLKTGTFTSGPGQAAACHNHDKSNKLTLGGHTCLGMVQMAKSGYHLGSGQRIIKCHARFSSWLTTELAMKYSCYLKMWRLPVGIAFFVTDLKPINTTSCSHLFVEQKTWLEVRKWNRVLFNKITRLYKRKC